MKKILSLTLVLLLVFSMMPMAAFADSTATVTFKLLSDGPCAELTVLLGETVEEPIDPEIFGCRFEGWYMDAGYTTPYDFDAAVTDDITLHAKWSSKPGYLLDWFENVPAGLGRMLELSEAESLDEFWSYLTDDQNSNSFGSTDYSDLVSDLDLVNIAFYISLVKCAGILLRNEDDFTKARDYDEVEALFKSMILFDDAAKLIEVLEQNDAGKTFMCVLEIYPDFISGINKIEEDDPEPLEEPEEEDPFAWPSYEERLFENICSAAEWGDELNFPGDLNSGLNAVLMGREFDGYYTSWIFDEELHAYDNFFAEIKDICDTIDGFADPSDADIFLISEDNVDELKKVAYPLIRLILSSAFDYSNSAYQKYILGKVSVIGTCIGNLMDAARFDEAQNEEMNNSEPPLEEYYYETPNTNLTLLDVVYAYYYVLVDYFNSGDPAAAGELTANEQAFKEYYEGAAPDLCHAEIIGDFEPGDYNGYVVNGIELGSICIDYVDWEDESKGYYAYIEESTEDDYIYHYLGAADGKLVYLEEPYVWSLKDGALSITETVQKTIKGFRIGLFKIPSRTVTTSTTYYLSTLTDGETLSTDPIETKYISRFVSSGHNYNCVDLGDGTHVNVCSDCGKQKGSPEAHEYSYLMDNFDGTHSWVCSECYAKITKEAHSYDPKTHQCECGTIDPSYIAQQLAEEMRRAAEEALRKAAEEAKRVAEEALRKAAEEARQAAEEVARAAEEAVKQAAEETARIAEETAKAVTNKVVKDTVTVSRGLGNVAQIILAGVVKALGRVF